MKTRGRPPQKFDMAKAQQVGQEIKAEHDAQITQAVHQSAIDALADAYRRGYMQCEKDHNLQPRPAGVTETIEATEGDDMSALMSAAKKLGGGQ
jgi:hypothetical protein